MKQMPTFPEQQEILQQTAFGFELHLQLFFESLTIGPLCKFSTFQSPYGCIYIYIFIQLLEKLNKIKYVNVLE